MDFAPRDGTLTVHRRSLEFEGRRYYYCEATPTGGWRFGEMPAELAAKLKRNIPIPLD